MKLIIRQYLASLKERDELDALLPDLLSQMGLNVFSRPTRGTRQNGVDVAAVGSLNGAGPKKVYLFSIKSGNLTRSEWDSSPQALRPSLNEIKDSYIPNCLPTEYKGKDIVICLCFGGDVQEQVRTSVEGYINENTTHQVTYEEWNGDKLSELVENYFLREELLPKDSRPLLRKALALLDEPDTSFGYFERLVTSLYDTATEEGSESLTSLRQMSICLWILFAWARDGSNLEAAYLSAERTLLLIWDLVKKNIDKKIKAAREAKSVFYSVLHTYFQITNNYLQKIRPHVSVQDGLSSAVKPSSSIDVNLKLFDVLGRLAIFGLWAKWFADMRVNEEAENKEMLVPMSTYISYEIKALIANNPVLLLPFKDDQTIDIFLAVLQLAYSGDNEQYIKLWLTQITERARLAYRCNGPYPCTIRDYRQLLEHHQNNTDYREKTTRGSILYPTIALWAAVFDNEQLYERTGKFKDECLPHCNFQLWYPDDATEDNLYTNKDLHGTAYSNVPIDLPPEGFLRALWDECEQSQHFEQLTSQREGLEPLTLLACRHYRIPVPVHFAKEYFSDRLREPEENPHTTDKVVKRSEPSTASANSREG